MCGLFLANLGEAGVNSLTPQYAYSPYCSLYISYCAGKENLFNNQEFLQLIVISFVLVTWMFDSEVILKDKLNACHSQGLKS